MRGGAFGVSLIAGAISRSFTGFATMRELSWPRAIRESAKGVVAFGLSDPNNLTARALEELAGKDLRVDVVMGSGAQRQMPFVTPRGIVAARSCAVRRRRRSRPDGRGRSLLARSEHPGSGALGLPTVGVIAAENQRDNARALRDAGAAVSGGTPK